MIYDVLVGETIIPNQDPINVSGKILSNVTSPETPIGSLTPTFRSWNFPRPTYTLGSNRVLFGSAVIRSFEFIVSSSHGAVLKSYPTQIFTGLAEPYFITSGSSGQKTLTYRYYVDKDNEYKVGIILNDNNEVIKPTTLTDRANAIISDQSNCVFECIINPDRIPLGIDNIEWYIGKTAQEIKYGFQAIQTIATDSYLINFTVAYTDDLLLAQRGINNSYVYVNKGTEAFPILIPSVYKITTMVTKNSNSQIYEYITDNVSSRIDTLEDAIGPISAKINGANSLYVSR